MSFTSTQSSDAAAQLAGWSAHEIESTAALLAALAHPLRLTIVRLLADGERSASDICKATWSSQPNISRHLGVLQNRKVILARKEASRIFYSLRDPKLRTLVAQD
ncbi:MAG: ArsR family transcriptional regulator [Betaproteobacteria bacterium HGW-Betaproteobacteria-12]|nr:MAG: ArsR family transcriptional regulator [Betaproteobacteria bacterium HGW-Betaproteobacteria-12]